MHFTKLIFEGCGTRYFSIVGSLKTLQEKGVLDNIQDIAATSGGVLPALLCGLNIDPEKMLIIINQINYRALEKKTKLGQIPFFGPPLSVLLNHGFQSTETIIDFVKKILSDHGFPSDMTFDDLAQLKKTNPKLKNLYFTAVNNSTTTGEFTIFSCTNPKTQHVQIAEAFAAAVAVPIVYAPVKILIDGKSCDFADGGTRNMFPYDCFVQEEWKHCLGIKLDTYREVFDSHYHKPGLIDVYFWHLLGDNHATYLTYPNVIQLFDGDFSTFNIPTLIERLALYVSGSLATAGKLQEFAESKAEKHPLAANSNTKQMEARTTQYKKQMEISLFPSHHDSLKLKKIYQEIKSWNDETEGCCVHYNALLDQLHDHPTFSLDTVFNKIRFDLQQLLQERAVKNAFLPNATPILITDVTLTYLQNNLLKKASEFLLQLNSNTFSRNKLTRIDHLQIIKKIKQIKSTPANSKEKEELIELVSSFRERRLMDHPGAYEAYLIAKFGEILQTKDYLKADIFLKKIKEKIPQYLEQVYDTTHQQFRETAEYGRVLQVIWCDQGNLDLKQYLSTDIGSRDETRSYSIS